MNVLREISYAFNLLSTDKWLSNVDVSSKWIGGSSIPVPPTTNDLTLVYALCVLTITWELFLTIIPFCASTEYVTTSLVDS